MRGIYRLLSIFLCLSATLAAAADISLQTPTTITGRISGIKPDFYISTGDTVSGPGNGYHLTHEPARHVLLSLEALPPAKKNALEKELAKKASGGQTITLHGEFFGLKDRGETVHPRVAFEVK